VVGALLALLLNIVIAPPVLTRDMTVKQVVPDRFYRGDGLVDPPDTPYGLNDPETAPDGTLHRWTTSHATLTFPYEAQYGRHLHVSLRIAGQPSSSATVSLNGHPVETLALSNNFQAYDFLIDTAQRPNANLHPADLQIDIQSTIVTGQDGIERGVDLQSVEVKPERSRTEIAVEAAVWGLSLAIILLVALWRLGALWGFLYGAAALLTFTIIHLTYLPRAIPPVVEVALSGLAWILAAWLAPKNGPLWGLVVAFVGLWTVVAGRIFVDCEVDDAYISYRYAWNLVQGHGLVYNPGERVEGYTNFLWTLLAAGALLLGQHPSTVALATNIACGICLLGLTFYLGMRLSGGKPIWATLAVGLLAVDTGFITYGARGSGLETVPFALLVLLGIALLWTDGGNTLTWSHAAGGVALALAALTRPEGLMVAAVLFAVRAWYDRKEENTGIASKLLLAALLPFLAIVGPYQLWRISFYGYLFPNTFYAKTGTSFELFLRGAEYVLAYTADHWLIVALALAGLLALISTPLRHQAPAISRRSSVDEPKANYRQSLVPALALLSLVYTLYIILAGGDWANGSRFFVPIAAPLVLLAQEAARSLFEKAQRAYPAARPVVAAVLVVIVLTYGIYALWLERPEGGLSTHTMRDTYKFQKWSLTALWIRDNTPPQATLAASPAGSLGYYSQRYVTDMFGLNDLHIGHLQVANMGEKMAGHEKTDPEYVLDKYPDYMMKYEQNIGYFDTVAPRLSSEYQIISVRTASGWPTLLLRRN
jgi:arabinofuranosyltransferase